MRAAVYLNSAKQNSVTRGHPWIFPKAIQHQKGQLITGQLVDIYSSTEELLGVGVYNEHSLYRVRVLALANEGINTTALAEIVKYRIQQAIMIRKLLGLPNEATTAYRLFNSEGDGLSGLTIDVFNQKFVIASSAYWVEAQKNVIVNCLKECMPMQEIFWFSQAKPLSQDGWHDASSQPIAHKEKVSEAGVYFEVDFANPQKTGLFIDQRENHQRIAAIAKDKRVLDLYTYSGGFALHAAKGGAKSVTAVDSSAQAIALAKQNAALNEFDCINFIEDDARNYLAKAGDYDLVILDPPKLVPSQRHLERAKNYYRFLHREVFKYMQSGSLLMTCNCSSAVSTSAFTDLVSMQARAVGKVARILGVYGPASCHPTLAAFPEGQYLTAVLLAIV